MISDAKKYSQLTQFNGEDRNPVFDSNNNDFYYLSEQNGSFNVFRSSLADPSKSEPLTGFTRNPVRFLSAATDNTLCFSYDGQVYTLKPGSVPKKIDIIISNDGRTPVEKYVPVNEYFSEAKLSPTGKEFAYVCRGEIFVTSIEGGITKRITNTPWQERSVSFSPDGRTLVFAAEKDNNWNVYTKAIIRKEEPYFYVSTRFKRRTCHCIRRRRVPTCIFS